MGLFMYLPALAWLVSPVRNNNNDNDNDITEDAAKHTKT